MRRREFLGTVAAAITTRMQGPAVPKPKYAAAAVERWMSESRPSDVRVWKAIEEIAELEKARPSFAALAESKGLLE